MEKDIKKALYENIMSSVAKEVKKALNESDELADKQARLKDLKQEYASLTSKINEMWVEYTQKMGITTDADAQREISNNFYKSLEPLKVAVRNKMKEIYNLTDEISELTQTISQSRFSKNSNYSDDNNYDDYDDEDEENGPFKHKFVVHKCSWKYCKREGNDYLLDKQHPIFAYIYDANGDFLPDYTPDWLYKIMDEVMKQSSGDYIEHQESMFGLNKKFYDALIQHPDCINHNDIDTQDDEDNIDDWKLDYDMEDEEYYGDEEIKEKLSNIILNPDFKVKAGGRFAPIGGKAKLDLIPDLYKELYGEEIYDKKDIHEILAESPKMEQVRKDIKYDVDFENGYIDHQGTTKDGIDYLALLIHGDWEEPVAIFVYWDGKKYRGYVPTRGNAINTINKSAFGNDEDADNEYCTKYLGLKDYYGCDGCAFGLPINWGACLEEFETRLVVKQ